MSTTHSEMTGLELHEPFNYVQETDPGAVGSAKYWLKVSTGEVKRRNSNNTGWDSIGGGGTIAFTSLSDVPSSYTGQGSKLVSVKSDASGLEFINNTSAPFPYLGDKGALWCNLWIDGSDENIKIRNGSNHITTVADKSSRKLVFSTIAGNIDDGTAINSLATIGFTGTQYLRSTPWTIGGNPYTLFIVGKMPGTTTGKLMMAWGADSAGAVSYLTGSDTGTKYSINKESGSKITKTPAYTAASNQIIMFRYDGSIWTAYANNVIGDTVTGVTVNIPSSGVTTIGAYVSGTSLETFNLAEMVGFAYALDPSTEATTVFNALKTKWGL